MGRYREKCGSAKLWVHSTLRLPQATDTCCMTGLKSKLGHRPGKSGRDWEGRQGGLCSFPVGNNEPVISWSPGDGLAVGVEKRGLSFAVITGGNGQLSQLLHFPELALSQQEGFLELPMQPCIAVNPSY